MIKLVLKNVGYLILGVVAFTVVVHVCLAMAVLLIPIIHFITTSIFKLFEFIVGTSISPDEGLGLITLIGVFGYLSWNVGKGLVESYGTHLCTWVGNALSKRPER